MKGGAVETPSWESRFGPKLYSFWWIVFTILTFFTGLSFWGGWPWLAMVVFIPVLILMFAYVNTGRLLPVGFVSCF